MLWIQKDFLPAISRTRFRQFLLSTFSIFTRSIQCTILGGIRLIKRNVDAVLSFRKLLPVSAGLPLVPPDPERVPQIRPVNSAFRLFSRKYPVSPCLYPIRGSFFLLFNRVPIHGTRTSFLPSIPSAFSKAPADPSRLPRSPEMSPGFCTILPAHPTVFHRFQHKFPQI